MNSDRVVPPLEETIVSSLIDILIVFLRQVSNISGQNSADNNITTQSSVLR